MKIKTIAIFSVVGVAMSLAPVWAGPVGIQRSLPPDEAPLALSQLEAKQQQVDRQLPEPPKGAALIRYMDRRSELQNLIIRIESGQRVSPDEIDQALRPTYR